MKKILALIMIFSLCAVLFGCKSGDEQSAPPQSQKEYRLGFAVLPSKTGTEVAFKAVFAAVITDTDGKIVKCVVDEVDASPDMNDFSESIGKEFPTKYALGADYGMASASPIGKEWSEQAKAFADYCVGKTVKELEESLGADGKIADLQASCTIYSADLIQCVKLACQNATDTFTAAGEVFLGMYAYCVMSASSVPATAAENGTAMFSCEMAATASDKDGKVYKAYIDEIESYIAFDNDGASLEDPDTVPVSKQTQGKAYGMAAASPIGKEWFEQINALADYCAGKTASQINGSVGEDGKVADLTSSCTVHAKSYTNAVIKALENAK
ncbi:MAG: hypothetical protein IKT37_04285 [Clostridia bacterium]|nr:hypothetical protein [Clostridia bacterium]